MSLAPIVLFVYNRPWHTKQTVEALQENSLASDSELFIYSDEAKNETAEQAVKEVRKYIHSINGFKTITVVERDKNMGLADSIIDGVTSVVNQYGKVIVLEDDLVTSPYFLKFMNDALSFYQLYEKVWHISGYRPPIDCEGVAKSFFIKPTSCWGWATWGDRWSFFKKDATYFLHKFDKYLIADFNVNNSYNYYSHLELNNSNKLNTWAIFWYATVYFEGGLSLHPNCSYVKNIGHDGSGVHCKSNDKFNVLLTNSYESDFSDNVSISSQHNRALAKYYNSQKLGFFTKVVRKIFGLIRGTS
ncbi:MAG: sugar transferase [Cycloclasticus sp. symbiont of Bathymodiolus heckerae]|nr:MAG: sugar transferase [Cycloclasticus sp. symbiont of Bathymodiolus heckerae]